MGSVQNQNRSEGKIVGSNFCEMAYRLFPAIVHYTKVALAQAINGRSVSLIQYGDVCIYETNVGPNYIAARSLALGKVRDARAHDGGHQQLTFDYLKTP
jgi:hypothetical protein